MRIVINPLYNQLADFIRQLPYNFIKEGESIYKERNELKVFQVGNIKLVVKSFKTPHFINKIAYTFFRPSKARRSYEYGLKIMEKGINTPAPIAYIENKVGGLLNDSYYICLFQENTGMMRELRTGKLEGRENMLRDFARFSAHIHNQDVLHMDYSPGNILYNKTTEGYTFCLIDINRMKFGQVDMETGCANFSRLWGNDEMIEYIAEEYAKARGFDTKTCTQLSLKYHTAFWKKYARQHNGFLPYINS